MTMPARERLRELVTDFYHGLITEESYQEQRKALLDDIDGFNTAAAETAKAPPKPVPPASEPLRTEPAPASPDEMVEEKRSGGVPPAVWAGVAVVAIAAAAGAFLFLGGSETPDAPEEATPDAAPSVASQDRGETILVQFLEQNVWSRDSLANLSIAWNALDDEQREVASGSRTYRRMTSRLHQRIREELALDTATSPRLNAMLDLASTLDAPYTDALGRSVSPAPPPPSDPLFDPGEVEPVVEASASEDAIADEPFAEETAAPSPEPIVSQQQVPESPAPETRKAPAPVPEQSEPTAAAPAIAQDVEDLCPASLANSRRPYCRDALATGGEGPTLVVLSPGNFEMGSTRRAEERPPHNVSITEPVALSVFEVTVAEYQQFCVMSGAACPDSPWPEDDAPVVMVSWDDANAYAAWLSEETGFTYRLPTEAEWEYAARGGTNTPYYFGDEITPSSAHSSVNGPVDEPLPASSRTVNRNPFKLFHMSGNVREWVADGWRDDYSVPATNTGPERVVRGGSFGDPAIDLRSSARKPLAQDHRDAETGFRVVREISVPK